jgi:hypothetical protein
MALQLATESLGEREERDFQRRLENPPSPATERRLLLTAKRFHTVCKIYVTSEFHRSQNDLRRICPSLMASPFRTANGRRNVFGNCGRALAGAASQRRRTGETATADSPNAGWGETFVSYARMF